MQILSFYFEYDLPGIFTNKKNEICLSVCLSGYTFRHALMSHLIYLDIDRGHIFRKHRHKNNKKVAVIYEKTVKKPAVIKVFASRLLWSAYIYCQILSVRYAYASIVDAESFACKRLGAYRSVVDPA